MLLKNFCCKMLCVALCSASVAAAQAQKAPLPEPMGIAQYDAQGYRYRSYDALAKVANLRLSANGKYVKVQLGVNDASLQQRLLHGGLTIAIDPLAKKSADIAIVFPKLMPPKPHDEPHDGDELMMGRGAERMKKGFNLNEQLEQLSALPVVMTINGDTIALPPMSVSVGIDDMGYLDYTAIVPLAAICDPGAPANKWQVGLISELGDFQMGPRGDKPKGAPKGAPKNAPEGGPGGGMGGPGGGMGGPGGGMGGPGGGMGGPGGGMGGPGGGMRGGHGGGMGPSGAQGSTSNSKLNKYLQEDIQEWIKVSYKDIQN